MKVTGTDVITLASGSASIAVVSTAVVYTHSNKVAYGEFFNLFYQAKSDGGTPDVKIEMEVSYQTPATEGSEDADHWVEPEKASDIEASLVDETIHTKAINPPVCKYIRFKITGNAGNPADTLVSMRLTKQEN